MKHLLRASALCALALLFTACPNRTDRALSSYTLPGEVAEPTPTPAPYEDPKPCTCYVDAATGRMICNSACSGKRKP